MKTLISTIILIAIYCNSFGQWNHIYTFQTEDLFTSPTDVGIQFANDSLGFAYVNEFMSPSSGSSYTILKSIDYGETWDNVYHKSGTGCYAYNITAINTDTILCVVHEIGYYIKISLDGGISWENYQGLGEIGNYFSDILFVNSNEFYAAGTNCLIKSNNGLVTTIIESDSITFIPGKISLINNHSYILAKDNSGNSEVLFSNNAGNSWVTKFITSFYNFNDLCFTSESTGYISCVGGHILKTIDYGETWSELNTNTISNLNKILFLNDSVGYCVGDNGICIFTDNAGDNWSFEDIPVSSNLLNINSKDIQTGYIVTSNFELLKKRSYNNISDLAIDNFGYYPIPCKDNLFFNYKNESVNGQYFLFDINRNLLKNGGLGRNGFLNLNHLNYGIYYIKTISRKKIFIDKIIKN